MLCRNYNLFGCALSIGNVSLWVMHGFDNCNIVVILNEFTDWMKATAAMMVLSMLAVAVALTASLLPLILKYLKKMLLMAAGGAAVAAGKVSFC